MVTSKSAAGRIRLFRAMGGNVASVLLLSLPAWSATYTVLSTGDTGTGTLRWAIGQANGAAGPDTIAFNISGPGPHSIQLDWALPVATDTLVVDGYTQPGAYTATAGSPAALMIELDGQSAGVNADGIRFSAGGSIVRGLVINRFDRSGVRLMDNGGNRVEGNYLGTNVAGTVALGNGTHGVTAAMVPDNIIGGTTPAARNIISGNDQEGVWLYYAASNLVQGNYIGTDPTGTVAVANGGSGVYVGPYPCDDTEGPGIEYSTNNTIGGTAPGSGNLISGNVSDGVTIYDYSSAGNVIQGNLIGTDVTGTIDLGNGGAGVGDHGSDNTVGGTVPGARNVLSGNVYGVGLYGTGTLVQGNLIGTDAAGATPVGNAGAGVYFWYGSGNTVGGSSPGTCNIISGNQGAGASYYLASGNSLQGNYIGTAADGSSPLGNQGGGVYLGGGSNNTIGGGSPGESNVIAHNGGVGVAAPAGAGNAISRNSIHANAGLGIDLGGDGVTLNDSCDVDGGANTLQNHPILAVVSTGPFATSVDVALNSTPNTSFCLELFSSSVHDSSGYGEGETFVGSATRITDAGGNVTFTMFLSPPVPVGCCIAGTATDPNGNTSEFGPVVYVGAGLSLAGEVQGGQLRLDWTPLPGSTEYWVYGADNDTYFQPGMVAPYLHRLAELPPSAATWSCGNGIGDVDHNWTYLVVAIGAYNQEMATSNRFGEFDFGTQASN